MGEMTVVREAEVDADLAQATLGVEDVIERRHEPSAKMILVDRHTDDGAEHVGEMKRGAIHARSQRGERPRSRRSCGERDLCCARNVHSPSRIAASRASLRNTRNSNPRNFTNKLGRGLLGLQGAGNLAQKAVVQEPPTHDDACWQANTREPERSVRRFGGNRIHRVQRIRQCVAMEFEHETVVAAGRGMAHAIGAVRCEEEGVCTIGHDLYVPAQVLDKNTGFGKDDRMGRRPFDRSAITCRCETVNAADAEDLALEQDPGIAHDGGIWQHCQSCRNRPVSVPHPLESQMGDPAPAAAVLTTE